MAVQEQSRSIIVLRPSGTVVAQDLSRAHVSRKAYDMRRSDPLSFCLGIIAGIGLKTACDLLSASPHHRRTEPRDDYVRPAGTGHMQTPPKRWDIVDEQSDESFPASDPPTNY